MNFKFLVFWSFLKRNWEMFVSATFSIAIFFYTKFYEQGNEKYFDTLSNVSDKLINASSIISAIIITYLISKTSQFREEKLSKFPEYFDLTQKTHYFRNAIHILYKNFNFWVPGLKQTMDDTYADLNYYDIRKVVFVNHMEKTELAKSYLKDERYGDTTRLYLDLKSFFPEQSLFDPTLYVEFDVEKFYHPKVIQLWRTLECGSELYYFFNYKYGFFNEDFNFDKVHLHYQKQALEYAIKVDKERYKDIEFNHTLYDMLGRQFTEDILPRLAKHSDLIHQQLPPIVENLVIILLFILAFGIIIPFFNTIYTFNSNFQIASISIVLSVIFYIILAFRRLLKYEMKVIP